MAPEQFSGTPADARSDLFGFGVMLYEMITGRRAFDGRSHDELVTAIVEREPTPIAALAPQAPPALQRLVSTCLAKDPDERWQTARDLLRELHWLRDDRADSSAAAPSAPAMSRRSLIAALAVGVIALGAIAWTLRADVKVHRISFSVPAPQGTRFDRGSADCELEAIRCRDAPC